jgi:hypothetical protein
MHVAVARKLGWIEIEFCGSSDNQCVDFDPWIAGDYGVADRGRPPLVALRRRVQALDHAHCFIALGAIGGYHVQISGADAHVANAQSRFGALGYR